MEAGRIIRFLGGVSCLRCEGPLGLTLMGQTTDYPGEVATLTFDGSGPSGLPEALEEASVQEVEPGRYRIQSGPREWVFSARSAHLHREVSAAFYRAVVPREVRWSKRLFWNVVLLLASSRLGRRLLLALRGR